MNGNLPLGALRGSPFHINTYLTKRRWVCAWATLYLIFAIRNMHSNFVTKGDWECQSRSREGDPEVTYHIEDVWIRPEAIENNLFLFFGFLGGHGVS